MKRRLAVIVIVVTAMAGGVAYYRSMHPRPGAAPMKARVTRGDVVQTVDATGTVEAVTTVQVGTQVSGTIQSLYADFNSRVRKGQVIARLDPSLFQTQVDQAQATVRRLQADAERARVDVADTRRKLDRAQELFARQLISASDLDTARANAEQAQAALKSAEAQGGQARAALHQTEVNLAHTIITAPIDGVVISRNVDVGQTVAASMQAPTLFVIARDLTRMQVRASVNEADIGVIQSGQPVTFRVDAYPEDAFAGTVSQVRLQPVVEQNVVSYTTVIDVPNPDLKLKPGMTANVTVEIARTDDVLRVPNAALRFQPTSELFAALGQSTPEVKTHREAPVATTGLRERREPSEREPDGSRASRAVTAPRGEATRVWILRDGRLQPASVRVGITDGTTTAILAGELVEGADVLTGVTTPSAARQSTSSPLLPLGGRRGGGAQPRSSGQGGAR